MTGEHNGKRNALWAKVTEDGESIGIGIYEVDPATVADPVSGFMAKFLAGVLLQPEQCYEIAQKLTLCGMKVEDNRKGRPGPEGGDGVISRDDGGV